jgi:hypothetical protein
MGRPQNYTIPFKFTADYERYTSYEFKTLIQKDYDRLARAVKVAVTYKRNTRMPTKNPIPSGIRFPLANVQLKGA